jgi:hypothetical protein
VIAGSVYTILAFIGFEAAAPLAEETKDPQTDDREGGDPVLHRDRRLLHPHDLCRGCVLRTGRFFEFPASGGGNPWDALARAAWGRAGSGLPRDRELGHRQRERELERRHANLFAMGRIRLFLRCSDGRTRPYRSPQVAVLFQFVIGVGVALWLGAQYNSPFTAFAMLGTIIGAVVIAIYMMVNLACLLYYAREHRDEFNLFLHGIVPILGILPSFQRSSSRSASAARSSTSSLHCPIRSASSVPSSASGT